jgi:hypothetical protein
MRKRRADYFRRRSEPSAGLAKNAARIAAFQQLWGRLYACLAAALARSFQPAGIKPAPQVPQFGESAVHLVQAIFILPDLVRRARHFARQL